MLTSLQERTQSTEVFIYMCSTLGLYMFDYFGSFFLQSHPRAKTPELRRQIPSDLCSVFQSHGMAPINDRSSSDIPDAYAPSMHEPSTRVGPTSLEKIVSIIWTDLRSWILCSSQVMRVVTHGWASCLMNDCATTFRAIPTTSIVRGALLLLFDNQSVM